MYKNRALSLLLISSLSLIGVTKKLTFEEKVEKRFNYLINEHTSLIQVVQERAENLQHYLETILNNERRKSLKNDLQEQLETYLLTVFTKISEAQKDYATNVEVIYRKITRQRITKAEMQEISTLYLKHLELFSDEIAFLIKLLLPLKDLDTMTEEEIQAALTF